MCCLGQAGLCNSDSTAGFRRLGTLAGARIPAFREKRVIYIEAEGEGEDVHQ